MRCPLYVEVLVGRAVEQQGEHHLGEELALQVRLRRGRLGQPPLDVADAVIGDHVPAAFGPGALLNGPGDRLSVPGQPGQRGVHLAVPHRFPPAEEHVVVTLEVIAVTRPPFKEPEQCQWNAHTRETTPRVFSHIVVEPESFTREWPTALRGAAAAPAGLAPSGSLARSSSARAPVPAAGKQDATC